MKWRFVVDLEDEYMLFQTEEDYNSFLNGGSPAHVGFDVAFGEGSSWTEYGEGRTEDELCDDNIVCELHNVVPWETEELFNTWKANLTVIKKT